MDLHLMRRGALRRRARRASTSCWAARERLGRRRARRGRPTASPAEAARPATSATCCCPRCTRCRPAVGWISPGGLNYVSERLTVPPAEAYGVATFYAMFSDRAAPQDGGPRLRRPRVPHRAAASWSATRCEATFGDRRAADGDVTWCAARVSGMCERAPAALVQTSGEGAQDAAFGHVDPRQVQHLVTETLAGTEFARPTDPQASSAPQTWDADGRDGAAAAAPRRGRRPVLDRRLPGARRLRGAAAGARAWARRRRSREITDAKLLGRGGAAFPTGVKWKAVAEQPVHPHYFICNADESEPGTFKDRVVMEHDPFAVIEALTIAGITTGCEQGYLYIRGEYPLATERLEHAIDGSPAPRVPGRRRHGPRRRRSTSSCGGAPAPTSAARRRRCSTRSRASAASRATSRPSRCSVGCSASPPGSTTWRP